MICTTKETIFQRCRAHLPSHVPGLQSHADSAVRVGAVCGLNNRWRLYRYSRDDTFRMHRDGGWANTRLCEETGCLLRPSSGRWLVDEVNGCIGSQVILALFYWMWIQIHICQLIHQNILPLQYNKHMHRYTTHMDTRTYKYQKE